MAETKPEEIDAAHQAGAEVTTTSRLGALYEALRGIGQYYKLSSFFQDALKESSVSEGDEEQGTSAGGVVSKYLNLEEATTLDFVRDLLFSNLIGCLPADDIVTAMIMMLPPESQSILAIQPALDNAEDLSCFHGEKPWPNSPIFTGADLVPINACSGFQGMTAPRSGDTAQAELAEESAALSFETKVYNISSQNRAFSNAAADNMTLTVFLNALSTIEMSRAVPYLDVQFLQEGTSEDFKNPLVRAPNLYRFLLGQDMNSDKGSDLISASRFNSTSKAGEEEGKSLKWISGMEVFTSPQTLVNADEHGPNGPKRIGGLTGNQSGVLDPFRPFMSLMSLTINVYPRVNSIIFTEGQLVLKLHDKSRIGEISGLTSPGGFGKIFMMLTYGWSHPDGKRVNESGQSANPFGMFIDSMKTTEHFTVSNASYSFTPAGEVDLTLKIYSRAAGDLTTDVGILDDVCANSIKLMQEFEDLAMEASNTIPDDPTPGFQSRSISVLKAADASSGAYAMTFSDTNVSAFKKQLKIMKKSPDADLQKISEEMFDRLMMMNDAKEKITTTFEKKLKLLSSGPDPWLCAPSSKLIESHPELGPQYLASYLSKGKGKKLVSFAKAVSIFIGGPLKSQGNYAEVQFFYGCLNDKASYARSCAIASFPLPLTGDRNLPDALRAAAKATGYNMTLGDFMGLMNNYYFDNHLCPVYGFSRTKGVTQKIDKDTGLIETKYKDDKAERRSADAIEGVLAKAYNNANWPFIQPLLTFSMKTAPIATLPDSQSRYAGMTAHNQKNSILRVYFEDTKADVYTGTASMIQTAFQEFIPDAVLLESEPESGESETTNDIGERIGLYNSTRNFIEAGKSVALLKEMGLLKVEGGQIVFPNTGEWKELLKSMSPYIDVGSSHTAVQSLSVQNQGGGELQTINMLRGSMNDASGRPNPVQMPMQMLPSKATAEFFGCPLLAPMQQFFIDMRTGTDIDSTYSIFKVAHTIAPGKFTTQAELLYSSGYSRFQAAASKMNNLAKRLQAKYPGMEITGGNYDEFLEERDQKAIDEGKKLNETFEEDLVAAQKKWDDSVRADGEKAMKELSDLNARRAQIRAIKGQIATCHVDVMGQHRRWMEAVEIHGQACYDYVRKANCVGDYVDVDHKVKVGNKYSDLMWAAQDHHKDFVNAGWECGGPINVFWARLQCGPGMYASGKAYINGRKPKSRSHPINLVGASMLVKKGTMHAIKGSKCAHQISKGGNGRCATTLADANAAKQAYYDTTGEVMALLKPLTLAGFHSLTEKEQDQIKFLVGSTKSDTIIRVTAGAFLMPGSTANSYPGGHWAEAWRTLSYTSMSPIMHVIHLMDQNGGWASSKNGSFDMGKPNWIPDWWHLRDLDEKDPAVVAYNDKHGGANNLNAVELWKEGRSGKSS